MLLHHLPLIDNDNVIRLNLLGNVLVLLAIHKNRNRFWELYPRYIRIPQAISQRRYGFIINHHIRFPGASIGQLLKLEQNSKPVILTTAAPY